MKKKKLSITNIGTVTLLMVFIVLCMITFAALSLASVSRDARLARQTVEHTTEYYTASNQAEELLEVIDNACAKEYGQTADSAGYYRRVQEDLISSPVEVVWTEETFAVCFQIEINDSQALSVLIDLLPPEQIRAGGAGSFYKILSWEVIRTSTWESDNTLQLIQ